jgi:hypothetical protein
MSLSEVMMTQYSLRTYSKDAKALAPYPSLKETDKDELEWNEVVEGVSKARKK